MALWEKVREGIDKAGKAAQDVFDEGKLRLEAYQARERADKAAEALGYAVFRAGVAGHDLEPDARERLVSALRERDDEARRLEDALAAARAAAPGPAHPGSGPAATGGATASA